jgi:hypothetical protein
MAGANLGVAKEDDAMTMGKRQAERQDDLWIVAAELPQGPGHPFYRRLNQLLAAKGSESFSATIGRPAGLPADYYEILANIVPVQSLTESNLANNLVMLTATGLSKTIVSS